MGLAGSAQASAAERYAGAGSSGKTPTSLYLAMQYGINADLLRTWLGKWRDAGATRHVRGNQCRDQAGDERAERDRVADMVGEHRCAVACAGARHRPPASDDGGHDRQLQAQVAGQARFKRNVLRQHNGMGGDERNVVVG